MQKTVLTLALALSFAGTAAVAAEVKGGSTNTATVVAGSSTLFGSGSAGLKLAGSSAYINLAGGPVAQSNNAIARGPESNGKTYLKGKDINILAGLVMGNTKIAQVWKNNVSYNGDTTSINSVRQMITPPSALSSIMPNFGGLVIGKVEGSNVYFGEWSPKGSNYAVEVSTDLNMGSAQHTAWYAGENPTTTMPTLVNANYNVVGINQHNPESPNVYKGVLTANYTANGGSNNKLTGSLVRGSSTLDFADTIINSNGGFSKGTTISGQFYNNANALAGTYKGATAQAGVAFGGARQ